MVLKKNDNTVLLRTVFSESVKYNALQTAPKLSLREKCPNTEFLLVRIFLYSDWIPVSILTEWGKNVWS